MSLFTDRRHAGRVLASELGDYVGDRDVVVLALPRGGVPVAVEVADHLGVPLDVFVVRRIGVPGHEVVAIGMLGTGGLVIVNQEIVRTLGVTKDDLFEAARVANRELGERERTYRGDRPPLDVSGKTVLLVDDGLATGATMRIAIQALRQRSPARIVAAVPVAPPESCAQMADEADATVCARTPEQFRSLEVWYQDFAQVTDDEVHDLLAEAWRGQLTDGSDRWAHAPA